MYQSGLQTVPYYYFLLNSPQIPCPNNFSTKEPNPKPSMKNTCPTTISYFCVTSLEKLVLFSHISVFSKGDPKVFDIPATSYLHKNFFSFNFTIDSRLTLSAHLDYNIFRQGHRESFLLELVKNKPQIEFKPNERTSKIPLKRFIKIFFKQVKLLNVTASCIQVGFKKINELNKNTCHLEFFSSQAEKGQESRDFFEGCEKLLMFEIFSYPDTEDFDRTKFDLASIQQKLIDVNYCKTHSMKKTEKQENKLPSAFSFYSFEGIPLGVRRNQEKEEEKLMEAIMEGKKGEGYHTRSRKKVKINEEEKESSPYQVMMEENDFLNIDSRN